MGGPRAYGLRAATFSLVGITAVAVGVWLWTGLVAAAGRVPTISGGGGVSLSASAVPKPSATPSTAAIISAAPTTAASSASQPPASSAPASSAAAAAPTSAPVPTSTPALSLTPVPPATFQAENTNAHTVIVGVQAFEHGSMLYRDDLKQIYVLTPDKKFTVY